MNSEFMFKRTLSYAPDVQRTNRDQYVVAMDVAVVVVIVLMVVVVIAVVVVAAVHGGGGCLCRSQ